MILCIRDIVPEWRHYEEVATASPREGSLYKVLWSQTELMESLSEIHLVKNFAPLSLANTSSILGIGKALVFIIKLTFVGS